MKIPLLIIGGGLSGLAAGIRYARFDPGVLILEKHSRIGGLNSYYYRKGHLIETGLHAITNFAEPQDKKAPLNRLLRQLKIKRSRLETHEQIGSEVCFPGRESLTFSNNPQQFRNEIANKFPNSLSGYDSLLDIIHDHDPFQPSPFKSGRRILNDFLKNDLLTDMILCPLMYYGSSIENDMDFSQFVIMFRAVFLEGFFRPGGTIKDFLDLLQNHFETFGGQIKLNSAVKKILHNNNNVSGVELFSGELIHCDHMVSTIGLEETFELLGQDIFKKRKNRLGFVESIFLLNHDNYEHFGTNRTIIFYNSGETFHYQSPKNTPVDFDSGVICFPSNFHGIEKRQSVEIRTTHLASYHHWKNLHLQKELYVKKKKHIAELSRQHIEKIIGKFETDIIFEDTFTPVTIERFTAKKRGAIYGSPEKKLNGDIGFKNLFLAGTDQGFLGIIGSMLSGVSMVNKHILPSL